ncbi:MAG: ACT domain-containing protein [Solirubrobacteraceae bacterium]
MAPRHLRCRPPDVLHPQRPVQPDVPRRDRRSSGHAREGRGTIGQAGGTLGAIDLVQMDEARMIRDITVEAADADD